MSRAESNDPAGAGGAHRPRTPGRSARRRARELALQGLYGWLLSGGEWAAIADQLKSLPGYGQADEAYLLELVQSTIGSAEALRALFSETIDRPLAELSPIEHSILLIATYELAHRVEIPYKVVINEAVELAKGFGATDGFRYVNGVLDQLAVRIRGQEARAGRVER
jgi:N utilization substance protein B